MFLHTHLISLSKKMCILLESKKLCTQKNTFFVAQKNTIEDSWVDWLPAVSDHALVATRAKCATTQFSPRRGRWHVREDKWGDAIEWMRWNSDVLNDLS